MNGDIATKKVNILKQIKDLINNENYINSIIVGHSGDDDKFTRDLFIKSGADLFEPKPTNH